MIDFLKDKKFYNKIYFISPHLDDAILSAGALIYELKDTSKVAIISVFTKASNKNNKASLEFTRSCQYRDARELFSSRRRDDKILCQFLKIGCYHLGFVDALWRENFNSLKQVFRKRLNNNKNEQNLEKAIIKKLKKIIKNKEKSLIFSPLALGNHIDHIIVKRICEKNFADVIFWEDYPYNLKKQVSKDFIKKNKFSFFEFKKNLFIKEKLISFYKSQISLLFGDKPIVVKKERYYYHSGKIINNLF